MPWELIITLLLPIIMDLFDKAAKGDQEAVALIRTIGQMLKKSEVPRERSLGIAMEATSRNSDLIKAQRDAFALKQAQQVALAKEMGVTE